MEYGRTDVRTSDGLWNPRTFQKGGPPSWLYKEARKDNHSGRNNRFSQNSTAL
jgi:hypothetical protein